MSDLPLAVAFPLRDAERARLRRLVGGPLPVIVPRSVAGHCSECDLELAVGPRVQTEVQGGRARLVCPFCIARYVGPKTALTFSNLGNPDSKLEE